MFYVDLSPIHELHQTLDVDELDVLHDEDGVLLLVLREDGVKVGAAGGKHDLVGLEGLPLAGQSDVTEGLPLEQLREHSL